MIIGINGAKGAGKDTVGSHLVEKYGFVRVGFADALKESAAALFDIDPAQWDEWKNNPRIRVTIEHDTSLWNFEANISVREFLQRYGTESHRDVFGDNFWVDFAMKKIALLDGEDRDVVITDMRFPNELDAVAKNLGVLWKIRRPEVEGGDSHASEQDIPDEYFDCVFYNTGTIENLLSNVDLVIDEERAAAIS